jgi:Tat protein translocase TatB subunit
VPRGIAPRLNVVPQISPVEILFVAVLALIVLGPEKLPSIARSIGRALNEARRMASEVKTEFESGMALEDDGQQPSDEALEAPNDEESPPEPKKDGLAEPKKDGLPE